MSVLQKLNILHITVISKEVKFFVNVARKSVTFITFAEDNVFYKVCEKQSSLFQARSILVYYKECKSTYIATQWFYFYTKLCKFRFKLNNGFL